MKIGHYTGNIWAPGGIASYIRRVSEAQKALGHELFFFDTQRPAEKKQEDGEIEYVADDGALLRTAGEMELDLLHVHTTLRTPAVSPVPLLRTVHFHRPYCPSGTRILKRQQVECNRSYSVGGCLWGHFIDRCGSIRPDKLRAEFDATRAELKRLDHIHSLVVSEFMKLQMLRAGYPESLVHVLQLPAPPCRSYTAPPQSEVPHFLFLSRITQVKGLKWLLHAVQAAKTPWHLDVAGSGPDEAAMRQLCDELGVANRVTFHGWCGIEETEALFRKCLAAVVPSIWHEPASFVHLESASYGRACVMSAVGGMPDYHARYHHTRLVPPRDERALAQTLDDLASHPDQTAAMGRAGYDSIQKTHGLELHVAKLHDLYALAIADFSKPNPRNCARH